MGVIGDGVFPGVVAKFVDDDAADATGVDPLVDVIAGAEGATTLVDVSAVWGVVELLPMQAEATMSTARPIMSAGNGRRWKKECHRDRLTEGCISHRFRSPGFYLLRSRLFTATVSTAEAAGEMTGDQHDGNR